MKAYKIELFIIDHDECGQDEIKSVIENARYPNRCISPHVAAISACEIGEWDDFKNRSVAAIKALEELKAYIEHKIYNRKVNIIQTFYGFTLDSIEADGVLSQVFIKSENVFCDIDEALEFAETNFSEGE